MRSVTALLSLAACTPLVHCSAQSRHFGTRDQNEPIYKDPTASVEDRVADLLPRMTVQEKAAQLVQGDFSSWINTTTNDFNRTGLVEEMETRASSFYVGYPVPQQWVTEGVQKAQEYLMKNTTLGIPAFVQSEGIHGFLIGRH